GALSSLSVAVQFELVNGTRVTLPIGLDAGGGWAPSPIMHVIANILPPRGEQTAVRFVFTPLLGGDWQIDDVYVDPRMRIWRAGVSDVCPLYGGGTSAAPRRTRQAGWA